MRTISRASSRDSCFCGPASLRGCHLSVWLAAQSSDQSSTGEPVIGRPSGKKIGTLRLGMVGGIWRVRHSGRIKTPRDTWESFSHAPEVGGMASRSPSATRLSSARLSPEGRRKKTLGFASLPHGRFAFIGAIKNWKEQAGVASARSSFRQTGLNTS